MFPNMPPHFCPDPKWVDNGASLGPVSVTCFTCRACKNHGAKVSWKNYHICLICDEDKTDGLYDWVNTVLLPFWRAVVDYEDEDPEDKRQPMPPQLPRSVSAFLIDDGGWFEVSHDESDEIWAPPDPLLVQHNQHWRTVISELGLEDVVTEVPNQYLPDNGAFSYQRQIKPWYTCCVNGAQITFGPRKRVDSITICRVKPFNVEKIAAEAKKADVSFWVDGKWHGWDVDKAKEMTVHATRADFVKYMKLCLEGL